MTKELRFQDVVIGTGQGGKPLAITLAKAGRKTAVVEKGAVGGSCINYGCTPTKTMVASARAAWIARRAPDYGIRAGSVEVDMSAIRARKQKIVDSFRKGGEKGIAKTEGLDLIRGEARFTDAGDVKSLEVHGDDGQRWVLRAERVFINTGARPANPTIDGLENVPRLDSTSIMELEEVPEKLIVLGGGYIGIEFGQMFRRFGSEVVMIQRSKQLLVREDGDVADEVAKILREDGIDVRLDSDAVAVSKSDNGIELRMKDPSGESSVRGTHLLVAVGRVPNTDALGLNAVGVHTDLAGHIEVNERLETNVKGIYALGDVKGGPAFTHISYDDYRVLETNLLGGGQATIRDRLVPYTVFMDPQLGRVGLGEDEARRRGLPIAVAKMPMTRAARAIEVGETRGLMKAVVDEESRRILGCAILGYEAGEVMAVVQVAMKGSLPYTALRDGVFAHPTMAEALNNLFGSLET